MDSVSFQIPFRQTKLFSKENLFLRILFHNSFVFQRSLIFPNETNLQVDRNFILEIYEPKLSFLSLVCRFDLLFLVLLLPHSSCIITQERTWRNDYEARTVTLCTGHCFAFYFRTSFLISGHLVQQTKSKFSICCCFFKGLDFFLCASFSWFRTQSTRSFASLWQNPIY